MSIQVLHLVISSRIDVVPAEGISIKLIDDFFKTRWLQILFSRILGHRYSILPLGFRFLLNWLGPSLREINFDIDIGSGVSGSKRGCFKCFVDG